MNMRFTDLSGSWRNVRYESPLPVSGGSVLHWLSDDFEMLDRGRWQVGGVPPAVSSSELSVTAGQTLLSNALFQPPCLIEAVITMTARAASDDFRVGLYQDDSNLVEWRAAGTNPALMDAVLDLDGVPNYQNNIDVSAANNSYRLASIYVGLSEVVWSYRPINQVLGRNEARRVLEHGIPDGPFRVRIAGLSGTSALKVHRVTAYQLADIIPPGGLGGVVEGLALPVRLVNTPFVMSPSSTSVSTWSVASDTFTSLAAGAVATGSNRSVAWEQNYVQVYVTGDQPFTVWLEAQVDGSNWQTVWYASSVDATADAVVRYFARSEVMRLPGNRSMRVRLRNGGASAGNFRSSIVGCVL